VSSCLTWLLLLSTLFGGDLALASPVAGLVNGSFETGDLTGWTRSAFFDSEGDDPNIGGPSFSTFLAAKTAAIARDDTNGVETTQASAFAGYSTSYAPRTSLPIAPADGKYLAFVSDLAETDAFASPELTGSSIYQTFTLPANAKSLGFSLRLLSNESAGNFNTNNAFGGLALSQGVKILRQYNIDLDSHSALNQHVTTDAVAGGFQHSTQWLDASFDVSELAGKTVTVTAYVSGYGSTEGDKYGDGSGHSETRVLIDNLRIIVSPDP
jgi:hypothetical protein